jgi:hypothetical protein
MDFNQLFIYVIFFLLLVLTVLVIKAIFSIIHLKIVSNNSYLELQENIEVSSLKLKNNNQSVLLVDDFNRTLIDKIFTISNEIIELQKFIFNG